MCTNRPGDSQSTPQRIAAATCDAALARSIALAAMLTIYSLAFFQRTGIPGTIFDELQSDFKLSAFAVTALGSAFLYVYAGMQLFVGLAADRFGGRRTLLFGSVVMCVGALLFPSAESRTMLFGSRVLVGFGSSFVYLSIVKEVDTLFAARHFASLLGLTLLASYAGNIAATLPFEKAAHRFGWRPALLAVAGLSVLAVVVAWSVLRRLAHVDVRRQRVPVTRLWDVLRNRHSRGLLLTGLINFPVVFVIQGILGKKFLEDTAGLTSSQAAAFLLVMAVVSGTAAMCGGFVLRYMGQRRKPVILLAAGAILLSTTLLLAGVLSHAPGRVFLVAYVLLALSLAGSPASLATMKEVNRPDAVAVTISVLNTAVYLGVGLAGNLAGTILDLFAAHAETTGARVVYPAEAYATLFACLTGLALLSTIITVLLIPETRGCPQATRGPASETT